MQIPNARQMKKLFTLVLLLWGFPIPPGAGMEPGTPSPARRG